MRVLSARQMDQMVVLATLEYALSRRDITPAAAVAEARREGVPEHLLDSLTRQPGKMGRAVVGGALVRTAADSTTSSPDTPTNVFLRRLPFSAVLAQPPLTLEQASALCARASERLGVPFVLNWASQSTRIEVDVKAATPIEVPGGLVREPGITPETLELILAHEGAHRVLRTANEARADYWAGRYGSRRLWSDLPREDLLTKGFLAAYGLVAYIGQTSREALHLLTDDNPTITVQLGGYPTLQSRWELLKAGLLQRDMPKVIDQRRVRR